MLKGKRLHLTVQLFCMAKASEFHCVYKESNMGNLVVGSHCASSFGSLILTHSTSLVDSLFFSFQPIPTPSATAPPISNGTATPTGTAIATASNPVNDQWDNNAINEQDLPPQPSTPACIGSDTLSYLAVIYTVSISQPREFHSKNVATPY